MFAILIRDHEHDEIGDGVTKTIWYTKLHYRIFVFPWLNNFTEDHSYKPSSY